MDRSYETYQLLVRIMEELSKLNIPVVFKGAMTLKHVVAGWWAPMERGTKDIDMDWHGGTVSMEYLTMIINTAVQRVGPGMAAVATREYTENKTAGFNVMYNGQIVASLDVAVATAKSGPTAIYVTEHGVQFVGSSLNRMLADKVTTAASGKIRRRIKDLCDLYILSFVPSFSSRAVFEIYAASGVELGNFSAMYDELPNLKHAYEVMTGVSMEFELTFEEVYARVMKFIQPFINRDTRNLVWNGEEWAWVR